jgi:hypothetical protein
MFGWILENIGSLAAGLVLAVIVYILVRDMFKKGKNSGCGCGCAGCSGCCPHMKETIGKNTEKGERYETQ